VRLEESFLQDILANPEDDAPRLVYADWLEETGALESQRARAELIRVQCELERLPAGDQRRMERERLTRRLLKDHAREWTAPLRKARLGSDWQFRRGFVEGLRLSARTFVTVAGRLFELAPVRSVCFPDASNEVDDLAACPYLARLKAVDLGSMCACGFCPIHLELQRLFRSRHVKNLTSLVLSDDRVGPELVGHLADSRPLAGLTTLDLSANRLGTAGVRVLAGKTRLVSLKSLALGGNDIGPQGARALAESALLAGLTSLGLADNRLGNAGARSLANSRQAAGLVDLDLRSNGIGDAGALALANSPHLGEAVRLELSDNEVGEAARAALRKRFGKRVRL
jgi:uncharacterized protein (TIGR02996 family)